MVFVKSNIEVEIREVLLGISLIVSNGEIKLGVVANKLDVATENVSAVVWEDSIDVTYIMVVCSEVKLVSRVVWLPIVKVEDLIDVVFIESVKVMGVELLNSNVVKLSVCFVDMVVKN